jgi:hypothetical protein
MDSVHVVDGERAQVKIHFPRHLVIGAANLFAVALRGGLKDERGSGG